MQPIESPQVVIVLSTFNGERYLQEQLDSIARQTFCEWKLVLRDDGSTDATRQIVESVAKQYPDQIEIVSDNVGNQGLISSFSTLIQQADADYVLFSDQDDVWLPDKISKTLAIMRAAEKRYGADTPLLVHTDLCVVDRNLQPLASSFWKYRRLVPQSGVRLHRLLVQNVVTGCTMMINRPLATLAAPIPGTAAMHDWWLALVAALLGKVLSVDDATILYRQHGENSVGANKWGLKRILQQIKHTEALQTLIVKTMQQAQELLHRYRGRMQPSQIALVEAYAALPSMPKIDRLKTIMEYKFFKHGFIRTVGFIVNLLALGQREPQ